MDQLECKTSKINTDDFPTLEFDSAKNRFEWLDIGKYYTLEDIMEYMQPGPDGFSAEPELKGVVRKVGKNVSIDLLKAYFVDIGDEWRLEETRFFFDFIDRTTFYIERNARYATPMGSLSIEVVDNVYGVNDKEGLKKFFEYYWHLSDVVPLEEIEINNQAAYLLENRKSLFFVWYCKENSAVYYLELPYSENTKGAIEVFSRVRCLHLPTV